MEPIIVPDCRILGKVIGVFRKIRQSNGKGKIWQEDKIEVKLKKQIQKKS